MRLGLDFDNTIVSYDALFHKVALEGSLIPADVAPTKLNVRDYLRSQLEFRSRMAQRTSEWLRSKIGELSSEDMGKVEDAIRVQLDLS